MTITKQAYRKQISSCGENVLKAAKRYGDYSKKANFKTDDEFNIFQNKWLLIVDDFRIIQSQINEIEIPVGHEEKGQDLRETYQKYVDYIEEKTMKFGSVSKEEIDLIQILEMQQAKKIQELTKQLRKDLLEE